MAEKKGNFFDGIGQVNVEKILTTEFEHLKYQLKTAFLLIMLKKLREIY